MYVTLPPSNTTSCPPFAPSTCRLRRALCWSGSIAPASKLVKQGGLEYPNFDSFLHQAAHTRQPIAIFAFVDIALLPVSLLSSLQGPSRHPDNHQPGSKMPNDEVKATSPVPREKLEAQIKSADMTDDMQQEVVEVAQEAMAKFTIEKDIAQHIKRTFDERKGPTWHCIVGRNFGSFVTHETKHFIYFYLGHCAILLFKTQ
ncbi:Dynein light chain type 1 domain containing protein [Rhypophila sp. PSN 637]